MFTIAGRCLEAVVQLNARTYCGRLSVSLTGRHHPRRPRSALYSPHPDLSAVNTASSPRNPYLQGPVCLKHSPPTTMRPPQTFSKWTPLAAPTSSPDACAGFSPCPQLSPLGLFSWDMPRLTQSDAGTLTLLVPRLVQYHRSPVTAMHVSLQFECPLSRHTRAQPTSLTAG